MVVVFNSTATLSSLNFVAARSGLPSPLKSAATSDVCVLPTAKLVGAVKVPPCAAEQYRNAVQVDVGDGEVRVAVAVEVGHRDGGHAAVRGQDGRAGEGATGAPEQHHDLAGGLVGDCESGSPSPLKSPTATANGNPPVAMLVVALKLPPAPPSSTETLPANSFATARSGSPSPLKSPTATELGPSPTAKLVGPVKVTGVNAHAGGAQSRAAIREDAARTARRTPRL